MSAVTLWPRSPQAFAGFAAASSAHAARKVATDFITTERSARDNRGIRDRVSLASRAECSPDLARFPRCEAKLGYSPQSRPELFSKHSQRGAPPICDMLKRYKLGKAMSCNVPLRNRVPRTVLDRYACFIANTFKADFHL